MEKEFQAYSLMKMKFHLKKRYYRTCQKQVLEEFNNKLYQMFEAFLKKKSAQQLTSNIDPTPLFQLQPDPESDSPTIELEKEPRASAVQVSEFELQI